MHTTEILKAEHFQYVRLTGTAETAAHFTTFCPGYQDTDRLGIVSPLYEDGILGAGYAILAFVTAFYDIQRSRSSEFFLYPQHFGFFDYNQEGVRTGWNRFDPTAKEAHGSWENLDVYPRPQWVHTDGTTINMLEEVIAHSVNHLLWPGKGLHKEELHLPRTLQPWLRKQLRSVYLYSSADPTVEIQAATVVEELVVKSIGKLPGITKERKQILLSDRARRKIANAPGYSESYRQLSAAQFVDRLTGAQETKKTKGGNPG